MTISAKPTTYAAVMFRSRLEAKWAAFFDLVEWRWTYEPVDLDGWVPDFVIVGAQPIFVEVKPFLAPDDPIVAETRAKIERAYQGPNEVLLLGAVSGWGTALGAPALGLLAEAGCGWVDSTGVFRPPPTHPTHWWQSAVWQNGARDFCAEYGCYQHRISGSYDGDAYVEGGGYEELQELWREAGNHVRWRGAAHAPD
jgi:hypothetical protein